MTRIPMNKRHYEPVDRPRLGLTTTPFLDPPKTPCAECPLRKDSIRGALGGYTAMQYLVVLHGIADLACHMSKGFPADRSQQRSCAGVAMYRAHNRLKPWGHAMEAVAVLAGEDRSMVFDHPLGFLLHHHDPEPDTSDIPEASEADFSRAKLRLPKDRA